MNGWVRNTLGYSSAIILSAILISVPFLSSVAESDIKVKASMNKQGKITVRILNNSWQDIYSLLISSDLGLSDPKVGKGWKVGNQVSDPEGMSISFATDSAPLKNGKQKSFYMYYKGFTKLINLTWIAKGNDGEQIAEGNLKILNRYEGIIEVTAKTFQTGFNLTIDNRSSKRIGTVGLSILSPIGDTSVKNVTAPVGWSYLQRELTTEEGAVFNGILIIPDNEENFITPNSTNSFKIDLSNGYNDYCVWLVLYTLFDTNDPNNQKIIKNDSLTVQNPSCSI